MIYSGLCLIWCLLARTRTWDPLIKSQLLYQLSYEEFSACKSSDFFGKYYRKCEKFYLCKVMAACGGE